MFPQLGLILGLLPFRSYALLSELANQHVTLGIIQLSFVPAPLESWT